MKNTTFTIGQIVSYKVCNSIYQGTIVKIMNNNLLIIDCEAGMELWNAGYSLGSEISQNQIITN